MLVVEDDETIRRLISVNLQLEGFETVDAVDGQDCLDKIKAVRPDLITLDVMMPRLDGWGVVAALRKDPATKQIPIVMLSARAQEADIQRGTRAGVNAYITKPFDPDELVATVKRLVGV